MRINKNYGICFCILGLSGSGKSTIGKLIKKNIEKKYGKTILIHGDQIRNIYNLKGYKKNYRIRLGKSNADLCKLITRQKINVIFTTVGLIHEIQNYYRLNIKNFFEIYIKSNIKNLLKMKKKIFYKQHTNFVWGIDLKPEFPKNPDIIINNNFKKSPQQLSKILFNTISRQIKE
jgi:adenylylsulfate kinase-like enzyme